MRRTRLITAAAVLLLMLLAAQYLAGKAFGQPAPTTQPIRGKVGENLSNLKPESGRVVINAGAQGEVPIQTPAGLKWTVLVGATKGEQRYDGDYTVKADEAVTFSVVNSPAKITAPGVVTLDVTLPTQSPQLHLLFPGRTELPAGIMVIRPGYTEQQAREQVFTNEYLAMMRRFNPGIIRAMDWLRTNGSEVTTWDSRGKPSDLLWGVKGKGGPLEPVIDLCNALGADLWDNIPAKADDDHVRQRATLIRDRLNPALRVYVELSNETWNNAGGFPQTEYFRARGDADPDILAVLPSPNQRTQRGRYAYAKRVSEAAAIVRSVIPEPGRVVVMLAGQTGDSSVLRDALAFGFKPDALTTGGYFNAPATAADDDAWFATFAANARAVYAGQQIAKFNALAESGPYRKLIYEWTGSVDDPLLSQASRLDPRIGGVYLAAGAGIFGNGFEAACNFVPLSTPESKYAAVTEVGDWNQKAQALADLSAAHPHPTLIEMKPDPRIAELQTQLSQSQAERDAAKGEATAAKGKIQAARQALQD